MNISKVAQITQLSSNAIRFYESKNIILPPLRSDAGYRVYSQHHIQQLTLISRAKAVGFSLDECRQLIQLADKPDRMSAEVKNKALKKLEEIEQKIMMLNTMRNDLSYLIHQCPGDEQATCPIMDQFMGIKD